MASVIKSKSTYFYNRIRIKQLDILNDIEYLLVNRMDEKGALDYIKEKKKILLSNYDNLGTQ